MSSGFEAHKAHRLQYIAVTSLPELLFELLPARFLLQVPDLRALLRLRSSEGSIVDIAVLENLSMKNGKGQASLVSPLVSPETPGVSLRPGRRGCDEITFCNRLI